MTADSKIIFCPQCGIEIQSETSICPHCGASIVYGKSAPKKRKKIFIPFLFLMLLLAGAAYYGSYFYTKKAAEEGNFEKAEQTALFGTLYEYLDPNLMPYLEAHAAYRQQDWYSAGRSFALLGDYLNAKMYYQECLQAVTTPTEEIRFYRSSVDLTVGDVYSLGIVILPEKASDKSYVLTSANEAIAAVEGNKITALHSGQTEIIVSQAGKEYNRCAIFVKDIQPTEMFFKHRILNGTAGKDVDYELVFEPTNTSDLEVVITIDNPKIAQAEGNIIHCLSSGTTTVHVVHVSTGLESSCTLNATSPN